MRPSVVLFAKAPVPGRVKTRLLARYSAAESAGLHEAFVRDMLGKLNEVASVADLELHTDTLTDAWSDIKVARSLQPAGDLGQRMLHALRAGLSAHRPRVMIVGSDAPTLPNGHLLALLRADADVALGPAEDGGYYAISCRRTHPAMFAGVEWSGQNVLDQTIRACQACGLSVAAGREWFDIDTPADVDRLACCSDLPPATAAWIERHSRDARK